MCASHGARSRVAGPPFRRGATGVRAGARGEALELEAVLDEVLLAVITADVPSVFDGRL